MFILVVADGWSGPREGEVVSSGLSDFNRMRRTWNAVNLGPVPGLLADVGRDNRAGERRSECVSCNDKKSVLCVRFQPTDRKERRCCVDVLQFVVKRN